MSNPKPYPHKFGGHLCHHAFDPQVYAMHNGGSLDEGQRIAAKTQAECDAECAAFDEAKAAEGTGAKTLAEYAAKVAAGRELTRRERDAVRRARELGKTVPAELSGVGL